MLLANVREKMISALSARSLRLLSPSESDSMLRSPRRRRGLEIAIEPLEDAAVDIESVGARVARQAVIAVGVGDELRRLAQLPERVEHHLALAEENRQILLAVQDQHRRGHLVEGKERRLRQVALRILERAAPHPRLAGL